MRDLPSRSDQLPERPCSPSLDDLLSIDSSELLRSDTCFRFDDIESGSSHESDQMSMFMNELDFDAEFFRSGVQGPDYLPMDLGKDEYGSNHSSDSGKYSPSSSSSDGTTDNSIWAYNYEPSTSLEYAQQPTNMIDTQHEYTSQATAGCHSFLPSQSLPFSTHTTTINHNRRISFDSIQRSQANLSTQKPTSHGSGNILYIVPSSKSATSKMPVSRISSLSYNGTGQTIVVKPEPSPTPVPIFISQTTGTQLKPIPVFPTSQSSIVKPVTSQSNNITYISRDPREEEYRRKQEDRKMKNRAAAQASRIRKKCEIDEMKSRVGQLEEENARLRIENDELRQKVARYEGTTLTSYWPGSPSRKRTAVAGACLMAVFMMVTIYPIDTTSPSHLPAVAYQSKPSSVNQKKGRLLEIDDDYDSQTIGFHYDELGSMNSSTDCGNRKGWLNKTETIRLNTDLYNWVERHEQLTLKRLRKGKKVFHNKGKFDWPKGVTKTDKTNNVNKSVENKSSSLIVGEKREDSRQYLTRDRTWKHLDMISEASDTLRDRREKIRKYLRMGKNWMENERVVTSYSMPTWEEYEKMATEIQQRPDMLYVVTMKDYFLLPALERNATSRPRLSFILPALSINGTISDQVSMMRIECDVIGTSFFNLSDVFVPLFFN